MTVEQITTAAWDAKDTTPPLDTIMTALELDDIPNVRRNGPAVVNRWTEVLNAWRDLLNDRGVDAAMPQNKNRLRVERGTKVLFQCANPECDFEEMWPGWKVRKQTHCSVRCASLVREAA